MASTEIERKFLLADDGWRDEISRSVPMKQAYLGGEGVSVRIRIAGEQAWLNIKELRLGVERAEFEYCVPTDDAAKMYALARGGSVKKTRHFVERDGLCWEIDEFEGDNRGLIVAEVELNSAGQRIPRPPWLGREVTDEERYYNVRLASHPYCMWKRHE